MNNTTAYVLGILNGKPVKSHDLAEADATDIECLWNSIVIDAIKLSHAWTPEEIGKRVNELGIQMLRAKANVVERKP